MPAFLAFCQWLQNSAMGAAMRNSAWLAPTVETIHICAIIALLTSNAILGLRLLGFEPLPQYIQSCRRVAD